jgi:hypothetical protein
MAGGCCYWSPSALGSASTASGRPGSVVVLDCVRWALRVTGRYPTDPLIPAGLLEPRAPAGQLGARWRPVLRRVRVPVADGVELRPLGELAELSADVGNLSQHDRRGDGTRSPSPHGGVKYGLGRDALHVALDPGSRRSPVRAPRPRPSADACPWQARRKEELRAGKPVRVCNAPTRSSRCAIHNSLVLHTRLRVAA